MSFYRGLWNTFIDDLDVVVECTYIELNIKLPGVGRTGLGFKITLAN